MVGFDAKSEISSILPEPTELILGGVGDGRARVSLGTPLGQVSADDPTPVQQEVFDISHPQVRYHFMRRVYYFDPTTGGEKVAPRIETITYRNDRGIIAIDPFSERTSDIMQPEEFARLTANSDGVFPLDLATARHTFRENNPIITPMVKEAVWKLRLLMYHALDVASVATDDGDLSWSDMHWFRTRLDRIVKKSRWDYDPKAKQPKITKKMSLDNPEILRFYQQLTK